MFVTVTYWSIILFLNFSYSNGDCIFSVLEFRISNCNNKTLTDEIGLPREYSKLSNIVYYVIGVLIILFRLYYYFNKKNLFNLKFGLKMLK